MNDFLELSMIDEETRAIESIYEQTRSPFFVVAYQQLQKNFPLTITQQIFNFTRSNGRKANEYRGMDAMMLIRQRAQRLERRKNHVHFWHLPLKLKEFRLLQKIESALLPYFEFCNLTASHARQHDGNFIKLIDNSHQKILTFTFPFIAAIYQGWGKNKSKSIEDLIYLVNLFGSSKSDIQIKNCWWIQEFAASHNFVRQQYRDIIDQYPESISQYIGPRAARFLARYTKEQQYALLHEVKSPCTNFTDLNLDYFKRSRRSPSLRIQCLPMQMYWGKLVGNQYPAPKTDFCPLGFKVQVYKRIADELLSDVVRKKAKQNLFSMPCGTSESLVNLVRLFEDYETIKNWVTKVYKRPWDKKGIHDAGMFRLPARGVTWSPAKLRALVLSSPPCIGYADMLTQALEDRLGTFPRNLAQVRLIKMTGQNPDSLPPMLRSLVHKMSVNDLSASIFKSVQETLKAYPAKTHNLIADVCVKSTDAGCATPGLTLKSLPIGDPTALVLGEFTGCCQSIDSAGEDTAIAGYTNTCSTFWVVEMGEKIIAQAWVWKSKSGHVVIDSVESQRRYTKLHTDVALLVRAAAKQLISKSDVEKVFIGYTESGITETVRETLKLDSIKHKNKPMTSEAYFDGLTHTLLEPSDLLKNKRTRASKASKEVPEEMQECILAR